MKLTNQIEIDFTVLHPENNRESEELLIANEKHLKGQCQILYDALKRGERLTIVDMLLKYGISDGRRRVKDLRDNGIQVKDNILLNRFKEYYI